jgi:hypothetical protein
MRNWHEVMCGAVRQGFDCVCVWLHMTLLSNVLSQPRSVSGVRHACGRIDICTKTRNVLLLFAGCPWVCAFTTLMCLHLQIRGDCAPLLCRCSGWQHAQEAAVPAQATACLQCAAYAVCTTMLLCVRFADYDYHNPDCSAVLLCTFC